MGTANSSVEDAQHAVRRRYVELHGIKRDEDDATHYGRMFGTGKSRYKPLANSDAIMMTSEFIPVHGLPKLEDETCIDDGRYVYSLRGYDEELYRAYYHAFLRTWGDRITPRHENYPTRHLNGEWCFVFWVDRATYLLWTGGVGETPMTAPTERRDDIA
jgi:hypothetical protein